jgi:hypothetical protein
VPRFGGQDREIVVFVLDGVLIGVGDQRYLALAGLRARTGRWLVTGAVRR